MRFWLPLLIAIRISAFAGEDWAKALSGMPLPPDTQRLDRSNCVSAMLAAFQPDPSVKALIFQPGATDELYFFRRARATLTNSSPTLLDAVAALTNQTFIRATFRAPFLLLHTDEDSAEVIAVVKHEATAQRLRRMAFPRHSVFDDSDWDAMLPALRKLPGIFFYPRLNSVDSMHFYRHSFAAWDLTGWEAIEAVALAGKTQFTVGWRSVTFRPDPRHGPVPNLEWFPK